ncbi:GRAA protein, partial [Podargus strigoides]|nr:GRAA protein [Podargus strigoides]
VTSHLLALLLSLIVFILAPRYGCTDIIGGHVVCPHSWPFMAAIQRENLTVCGGALAEKQWVLTAAHCKLKKAEVRVVLGAHQAHIAKKEQQIFQILHYFPNPRFGKSSRENDIKLLKVLCPFQSLTFCDSVIMFMPDSCEDIKHGTLCNIAGCGITSSGEPSEYLQEATFKIVDRKSCERKYRNYIKITNNMLCAIGKNKFVKRDACQADSGGPLICADRYRGIVSFGKGCGRRDKPGVYTRLTEKYID